MMRWHYWCVLATFFGLVQCTNPGSHEEKALDFTGATEQMARHIAEANAQINVEKASYLVNQARMELYRERAQTDDIKQKVTAAYMYCRELVHLGHTERAIVELEAFLQSMIQLKANDEMLLTVRKLLALAYLRLGEEENCIGNRNQASCIIPVAPEAIYTMTSGSEQTIRVCAEILEEHPDDYESMWMLNFAYMTIGQYPDGVPAKWLVEADFTSDYDLPRFADISRAAGITGNGLAGGCCVEDFNNDGLLDVISSSWGLTHPLTYLVNNGNGGFEDRSADMLLEGITGGLNLIHADYNNDGFADVFVLRGAWLFEDGALPNSLLRNNGDGTFTDVTEVVGLLTYAPTQTAVWADFNRDGWLDLFVGNESTSNAAFPCELHLSNGDGTFRNVINEIGVTVSGFIKGCAAGDVNNDMWPDLYVSDYRGPNRLLVHQGLSQDGVPQFSDMAATAGVQEPVISFPTWIWDFNNDGLEDIFVSGYGVAGQSVNESYVLNARGTFNGGHPRIYLNQGNIRFREMTSPRLRDAVYTMGCNYGDLDNDGFLDMYLGTGDPGMESIVPNKMYRNDAGQDVQDVTTAGGFGHVQKGHGIGFGDFDNDGDEDIFQVIGGAYEGDVYQNALFKNPSDNRHNWVTLRLIGTQSNRSAIGARVHVVATATSGERHFYRTVSTGGSFGSSSLQVELGLGDATAIQSFEVQWPDGDGTRQVFREVPVNTVVSITEGSEAVIPQNVRKFALGQ